MIDLITQKAIKSKVNSVIYCLDFEYKICDTILIENFNLSIYWKCLMEYIFMIKSRC
jgi:hypothetical protein